MDKLPLLLWLFYKLDPLVALLACTTTITIYSLDEDIWDFESACYTLYNIQLCQKSFWQLASQKLKANAQINNTKKAIRNGFKFDLNCLYV